MDNYVYNLAIRYLISNGISNVMVEDTKSNINEESNDIDTCPICKGNGVCPYCNGTGKVDE